jgi:glutamate/aspartate transport system substrate-binding protein
VEFAPTHFVSSIAVAVKKQSGISSMTQLEGKTVATVTGSTTIQLLRSYRRTEKKDFQELYGKDIADAFLLLSSGRANAMILEDVQLAGLIATSASPNEYKILDERLRDEPYGLMFRKDDPAFKELVNDTIGAVMKSGEINELYAKWFSRPIPPSGVSLNFPMSKALKDTYSNPNNRGI